MPVSFSLAKEGAWIAYENSEEAFCDVFLAPIDNVDQLWRWMPSAKIKADCYVPLSSSFATCSTFGSLLLARQNNNKKKS